jgi:hypothetical protein
MKSDPEALKEELKEVRIPPDLLHHRERSLCEINIARTWSA